MSSEPKASASVGVAALIAIFVLIGAGVWYSQRQNQLAPPLPGPPAPVVPQIPDIIGNLASVKMQCEGRAATIKAMVAEKRMRPNQVDPGRLLYVDAQAGMAECVVFLDTAMIRRFRPEDEAKIAALLSKLERKKDLFVEWTNKQGPPVVAAFPSLNDVEKLLGTWMDDVNKKNEQIIQQLRKQMQECRLQNWQDL